jgi:hypothetical protein
MPQFIADGIEFSFARSTKAVAYACYGRRDGADCGGPSRKQTLSDNGSRRFFESIADMREFLQ